MNKKWFNIQGKATDAVAEVYIFDEIGAYGITAQDFISEMKEYKDTPVNLRKKRMSKRQNKVDVVFDYLELLDIEISKRFGETATPKDILKHLVERGMVEPKRLRNYMIIADFDRRLVFNKGNRTHTFMDLSHKYKISESQAQNIVYKYRKKSRASENISY